jgi:hypothetical protein
MVMSMAYVYHRTLRVIVPWQYLPYTILEAIPEQTGNKARCERAAFQSGYCILEERKVVVQNKFLQTEGRINTLPDLIPQLNINTKILTEESKKLYLGIISKLKTEGNEK